VKIFTVGGASWAIPRLAPAKKRLNISRLRPRIESSRRKIKVPTGTKTGLPFLRQPLWWKL